MTPTPDADAGGTRHYWPELLPNGDAVLFTIDGSIVVESLSTGERRLLETGVHPHYASTGHLIYARNGTLYAVPFDRARLERKGVSVPVQTGVQRQVSRHAFAISETGTLVYEPSPVTDRRLVLVDLEGNVEELPVPPGPYYHVRFSPDGQQLVVSADGSIHLYELETERFSLLFDSFDDADGTTWKPYAPMWSPDGTRFAVTATARGSGLSFEIFVVPTDGTGPVEHLVPSPNIQLAVGWSRDGKRVFYSEHDETSQPGSEFSRTGLWEVRTPSSRRAIHVAWSKESGTASSRPSNPPMVAG